MYSTFVYYSFNIIQNIEFVNHYFELYSIF
nr:MAG TPA: hypothetical protein [Caudoviricetes sp.]